MYLEKLEIQGFKSFAKHTELVFNKELTAVVGPNGSGKSNIADAVRWVLGEQSSKTLRSKKSEDVIFAGSNKKGRLGFAQVDLYLNNKDKVVDIKYDQIIITRKIDRKGDSEYLINNNKVRLFDIQLLLAKANFGQKSYSVIGQGMIEGILIASPSDRKEFFDEATGVKQFQIKKDQAVNKLNNSKKNLEQTGQILIELEPRLRSLTRQVKKREKGEKVEKELKEIQTKYYGFLSNNINKDLKKQRKEFDKLQEETSLLNQELIETQTKLDQEENKSTRQDRFSDLQNKLNKSQDELNNLLKEKTVLDGKQELGLLSKGRVDTVWLKNRIDTLIRGIDSNKLLLEEKKGKYNVDKKEKEELDIKKEAIVKDFNKLENNLTQPSSDIKQEAIIKELNDILKNQIVIENSLHALNSLDNVPSLKEGTSKITKAIKILKEKLQNSIKGDDSWQEDFNKLLKVKDNLIIKINEVKTNIALLNNDISRIEIELKNDNNELIKLKKENKDIDDVSSAIVNEQLNDINKNISNKKKDIDDIKDKIEDFNKSLEEERMYLVKMQKDLSRTQTEFNIKNNELNDVKVELARIETKEEDLKQEIIKEIPSLKIQESDNFSLDGVDNKIDNLKKQLVVIGSIDASVVEEYNEVNDRYTFLKEQTEDLEKAIKHLSRVIKGLDDAISKTFDTSFKNINKLFNEYFKKLFNGGKAELILNITKTKKDDEDDEENESIIKSYGIDIKAVPPGKRLSSINMLSGGEKALTSIALICAIIANNPSPFVVLDEVDAALDEANSIRFGEILDALSKKTQFITITHNRATMHKAKIIYGVTMDSSGVSRLLSMNFDKADEIAA